MDRSVPSQQLPLSVTQEAMWVTWQLDPAKWEHVIPLALEVTGSLDLPRLRAACAQLFRHHPALRARVRRGADGMCLDWADTDAPAVTVRTVDAPREDALAAARIPFDLDRGPLSRVELLHGPDWTVLLITVHHIILDGTSTPVLLDDLRRAYAGEELAPPQELAPLLAHARRSREAAEGASGEPLRGYWRDTLAGLPPARTLPVSDDREQLLRVPEPFSMEPELTRKVRELARELGVSYFIVMLGALFVTLHHHTGSDDLIVSAPYHGRPERELKGRVGFFVNVLPFRLRLRAADSYQQLVQELRSTVRAGLRHAALPLPAILRSAHLLGPDARAQTHQVVFEYWDTAATDGLDVYDFELAGGGSRCTLSMLDSTDVADYRLIVQLTEGSTGSRMLWKDATGSVGPAATDALTRDYLAVVADMVADRHRTLAEATALLPAVHRPAATTTTTTEPEKAAIRTSVSETVAPLAEIWSRVLRIADISADDSFFELGGHSLLAATLLTRITKRLGVELSVRDLFGHPRLGDLAELIDARRASAPEATEDAAEPDAEPAGGTFPASGFQEGIWLAERLDPAHARYHIPLYWSVQGELDPDRLRAALAALVARHEILRTRFVDLDGRLHQEVAEPWAPALEEAELPGATEAEQHTWLRSWSEAAAAAFAPAAGRLLAAGLFTLPDGGRVLALCVHHLVLDGESVPVLIRELELCHQQTGAGSAPPLPPARQYRELVRSQQDGPGRVRATVDLAYWSTHLAGAPSSLDLAEPGQPGSVRLPLAAGLAERLLPLQAQRRASRFMVTAAALAAVLHRWSGAADLTFGIPVANRSAGAFGDVVGPCLNTLVLRSRCTAGTTFADLLEATREEVIAAFEHQSAPFDEVVRALRPARSPGRTPFVDCLLNSVSTTRWSAALGGARLVSLDHELQDEETNKFGLTVTLAETGGALQGALAHRGDYLGSADAARLAGDLAAVLNGFPDLLPQPVLTPRPTETS
ncbi:non-ribosomal peptide synthetase component F [Kitasatospora sp. MAA4]|uniref:condensation domain-containing protein n=1 Tax=Kitasatospora sp. MAA4 TaxID=3035093 RepID=UPI002474F148|nr:condensation domain-containing protein [Kitasatospora sp. MAA4]MDH6131459.1 non-ribosomal peptide synthetase component F [Kitasatospora sp. MAA4]